MKLNKSKLGSGLAVILSIVILMGFSFGVLAEEYELSKTQFKSLTGNYLSNVTINGEEVETGDTLVLDFEEIIQEEPLLIDLEKITVKPSDSYDTVILQQNWSSTPYPPGPPSLTSADAVEGQSVSDLYDGGIVIFKNGAHLESLKFKPSVNAPENAIEVDFYQTTDQVRRLEFRNLEIPVAGSSGGFVNGIKFDGDLSQLVAIGQEGTDYTDEIYFNDVRIDGNNGGGISGDGILFTETVGDVSDVSFNKLYVGDTETGIHFNNQGSLENITLKNSERIAPSVSDLPFALENNVNGVKIEGSNVTGVVNFKVEYVRIEDNTENGFYVKGDNHDGEATSADSISSIGFNIKNSLIKGNNGYGILVGTDGGAFSPAKIDQVILGNDLKVFDNAKGGAMFKVKKVVGSQANPGLVVKNSRFNEETTGDGYNNQAFGLRVDAYEGVDGAKISDTSFHDHDSGSGLLLTAPNSVPWYDSVEGVTVEGVSANNNSTSGLVVAANLVRNLEISNDASDGGDFSNNTENGIIINGQEGVSSVTIKDSDDDSYRDLTLNNNGESGLEVMSSQFIKGLHLNGVDLNENSSGYGAKISTSDNGYIGSDGNSQDSLSFKDVKANKNDSGGVVLDSAQNLFNHENNVLVESSEFKQNRGDGLSLKADGDVKNPTVHSSKFISNKLSSDGLYVEAKGQVTGIAGQAEVHGNEFAGNEKGLYMTASDLKNIKVADNTTDYAENNTTTRGNSEHSVLLEASSDINTVTVDSNIFFGKTDRMLELKSNGTSSNITVKKNVFRSGVISACAGSGTGVVLDATDAVVENNEFKGLSTAIIVKQENTSSPSRINKNNFLPCCITIDASMLGSVLSSGETLDAANNYWGGGNTREYIESTIKGMEYLDDPYNNRRKTPVVVVKRLEISSFTASPENPEVNDTVTLEYTLKNVFDSAISGQEVWIEIENPDGNTVVNTMKDSVPTVQPNDTYTDSHTFSPGKKGTYTATLEVDQGAYVDEALIDVGGAAPPTGDDLEPYWGLPDGDAESGILPAPINGDRAPYLELKSKDGDEIRDSAVDSVTLNVYDLNGQKVVGPLSKTDNLTELEDLKNGLYVYTVTVKTDETYKSPVMKFYVNQ